MLTSFSVNINNFPENGRLLTANLTEKCVGNEQEFNDGFVAALFK